jgi:hypothetical protein
MCYWLTTSSNKMIESKHQKEATNCQKQAKVTDTNGDVINSAHMLCRRIVLFSL